MVPANEYLDPFMNARVDYAFLKVTVGATITEFFDIVWGRVGQTQGATGLFGKITLIFWVIPPHPTRSKSCSPDL